MIRAPWIFNTLWYFIKGMLSARTISKVSVLGTSYQKEMQKMVDVKSLPDLVPGGERKMNDEEVSSL